MNQKRTDYRKYHFIYKTTCLITKRWYVGMHSTDDPNDSYLGSGRRLLNSIKHYGRENHVREILEYLPSRKELVAREEEIVNEELLQDPLCMNLKNGGHSIYPISETSRSRMSESARLRDPGVYKKIIEARRLNGTLIPTKETCDKISKAKKGKSRKPFSKDVHDRINAANRGQIRSQEARDKMSISKIGKKTHNSKRCTVDGITIFESKSDLIRALGSGKNGGRCPNLIYLINS